MACVRCLVSGRVQGVFFRASTSEQAQRIGLSGHVRNLPDDRVEVVACGEQADIDRLVAWLHDGPPQARVDEVCCEVCTTDARGDFRIT